jgi:predicted CXXCH cytochrome family protein
MTATWIVLALAATAAQPIGACGLCHPDVRVEHEQSVHAREEVVCHDCHGGNPEATTTAAAHRGTFRGVPSRRDIPAFCASCHSDIQRMRPYNLPADQFALYRTSGHGIRLAQGNEKVAVCTDCHGTHAIRRRDDPKSAVFPINIPATCGRCHGDSTTATSGGEEANLFAQYAAGVHGRAFLEDNNSSAPHCASCHGAHGAAPPGIGDVDKVCGQCHAPARTYFLQSQHAAARERTGALECGSCHDYHGIRAANDAMLDSTCMRCHDEGSEPAAVATTMQTLFRGAEDEIEAARLLVDRAAAIPLYVEDYLARLEEARTSLVQSFPVMHALRVESVEELTHRARSIAAEVESEVTGKLLERRWRRVGLLLFWFYLILTVTILVRYRRRAISEATR